MRRPGIPINEAERLAALASYDILDTPPEPEFDGLARLAAHILGVPSALVSFVDADRQWFKARHGVEETGTPREISFCGHVVASGEPMVIPDALADPRFADNPLVVGPPHVRFYAGHPIVAPDGLALGSLCAIDSQPHEVPPAAIEALAVLAQQVFSQLELRRRGRLLARERALLRGVLDAAVDAILVVDEAGRIEGANPATEQLFGHSRAELVGRNVSALMPEPFASAHDGHIRRYLTTGQKRVIGIGREVVARRKDGSVFPADLAVGEAVLDGKRVFTGIIRDVSARKAAEQAREDALADVRGSRDELTRMLNLLRIGTLAVDARGLVTFASMSCDPVAGIDSEAALGRRWEEVLDLDEGSRNALRATMRKAAPERGRIELRIRRRGGARWVEIDAHDDPRDPAGRVLFLYDASDLRELKEKLARARRDLMIGESRAMRELYDEIGRVAQGDWTVLIEGETGSGKELVAQAIHRASNRRSGPFIAVNCAGLTESIMGSQLFGHVRGAFTGAASDQPGLFEAAAGGTLFLDEIGDVSAPIQSTLLRALQEKEVTRLGETRARKVDVRIVAATNRDLRQRVAQGLFRDDLLYRIRNARIRVPSLRERREDIPLLVAAFLAEERVTAGKFVTDASPEAMARLVRCDWPGNVRELRSAIEHAVIRCRTGRIELADLPAEIAETAGAAAPETLSLQVDERARILTALRRTGGNRLRAAKLLGMGRATLYRRLAEFGIGREEFAEPAD